MEQTLYRNARIFTAETGAEAPTARATLVEDGRFVFVGDEDRAAELARADASTVDVGGRVLVPGFIDAHIHLLMTGQALGKVELTSARNLEQILERIARARAEDPSAARVLGRGWLFDSVPGGTPTAAMLDAVAPDIPVYLDANDLHSCWVNTAALAELGITDETPDPIGGRIVRDDDGRATGLLLETAATQFVWPYLEAHTTDADRDAALDRAFDAYLAAGVTGAVDMAFGEGDLAAVERALARHGGDLPVRLAAHWLIDNHGDAERNTAQIRRAAELAGRDFGGSFRVVGVKFISDGVIDACTASLGAPYTDGTNADPIWPLEALRPAVVQADRLGLQIAVHAIGDAASTNAIDALEHAVAANGERERRHRIEHLEYAAEGTAERLAALGITASMQPVHTDAAVRPNWDAMLGAERAARGFAWGEYEAAGALLAFSTDAPTAPHDALGNMYVATTRHSALDASFAPVEPEQALPLASAIGHATRDAAISVGDGADRGMIAAGYRADFAILDADPFADGPQSLLASRIVATFVGGREVFSAAEPARL
ncbi:amidohydrolase [Zhihengliuella salsuginis]|uniref:Amidohydrolase n=1 Tax=Zhihengliuella salsuginis TaxID=578222 RepID=A0ABQ3GE60_9MICC|nr:amidohydrolase [Zhihengliuella salsuginis]GHD03222.1 amidohydrolase [Zhihengliuella salsuginis]